MTPKYYSITQIVEIYGLKRQMVFDMCHARGQRFAFNPGGGKWLIDKEKFDEYLDRRQRGERNGRWG